MQGASDMQIDVMLTTHRLFDVSTKADRILLGRYKRAVIDAIQASYEASLTVSITHDVEDSVEVIADKEDLYTDEREAIQKDIHHIIDEIKEEYD